MVLVEVKKDSRSYFFYMPVGAPYADAVDAAHMVADDIKELHSKAIEHQAKMEAEQAASQAEAQKE